MFLVSVDFRLLIFRLQLNSRKHHESIQDPLKRQMTKNSFSFSPQYPFPVKHLKPVLSDLFDLLPGNLPKKPQSLLKKDTVDFLKKPDHSCTSNVAITPVKPMLLHRSRKKRNCQ